jgi:hypothetical protein
LKGETPRGSTNAFEFSLDATKEGNRKAVTSSGLAFDADGGAPVWLGRRRRQERKGREREDWATPGKQGNPLGLLL